MISTGRGALASALRSLKVRVTLGVVAALVFGIGSITTALVNRAEYDTLRAQRQRELSDAARTAEQVSSNVISLQRDLQTVAGLLDPATLANPGELDRFIRDKTLLMHFSSVFIAGRDGRVRVLADAGGLHHPDLDVGDRSYFRRTLAERRPIVSEAIASRVNGQPIIILTYPVAGANGIVAVISGSLQLSSGDLLADLVRVQESDVDALMVLTDAEGRVLAHPDRGRVMRSLADEPRLAAAFAAWVAQGSPMEPSGVALPQRGEVVSAAGAAATTWMVWRARSESELLAPLRAARREAIDWAAGLIALVSIAMFVFLWRELRPLVLLERRAQHLFDGESDADAAWPDEGGEIGRLGRVLRHVGAERAQLEAFNTQVIRKLGSVMSAAPIGIAFTRDQRFELVSAEFCRLLGRTEQALLGQSARMIYASDEDYERLGAQVRDAFDAGRAYAGEWQMRRADETRFWASLRGNAVDAEDPSAGAIWSVADISDQRVENEHLTWLAMHDPLTGLANRKLLHQRAGAAVAAVPRSVPAAMVFIDLDRFKPINDTAGHAAGDAMLRVVAAALISTVRASDLVVRMGGDEFALLLERCGQSAAVRVAESVRAAIDAIALEWEGRTLRIGASLGVACLRTDTASVDAWVAAADAACYAAKAAGRGTVRVHDSQDQPAPECADALG